MQEKEEDDTHEAESLMMHQVVYLNEKNVMPKDFDTCSEKLGISTMALVIIGQDIVLGFAR